MFEANNNSKKIIISLLAIALAQVASASIEKEPVKVTHKNSGPKYEIDDGVERTRLEPQDGSSENLVAPLRNPFRQLSGPITSGGGEPQQQDDVAQPIGRVSIRRIFLVPMSGPPSSGMGGGLWDGPSSQASGGSGTDSDRAAEPANEEADQQPRFTVGSHRPTFWPFAMPPRHHLFGADEASRSPPQPESSMERPSQMERAPEGEREESDRPRLQIDPIQMMIELMQHALNSAAQSPQSGSSLFKDLNKEASSSTNDNDQNKPAGGETEADNSGLERPAMPAMKNETKEDVVEIDGKKYLRKTVINRHVGENIIFMTKRLIFMPLNETTTTVAAPTSSEAPPTTTTATNMVSTEGSAPSQTTTTVSGPQEPASATIANVEPKLDDLAVTSTTTGAPTTGASEVPTTQEAAVSSTTTTTTASPSTTSATSGAEETTRV